MLTRVLVPIHSAIALIREGRFTEGTASLEGGLAALEEGGGRVMFPCWKSALAEGMARLGDLESALHLIDEIIAQVERPGWEERSYYAETLRLKGWMLSLKDDLKGPSGTFSPHSNGHGASRRNPGSSALRPAWHSCGRAKANAKRRMSCSPRFTAGLPRASTPRICWTRSLFSPNWGSRSTQRS